MRKLVAMVAVSALVATPMLAIADSKDEKPVCDNAGNCDPQHAANLASNAKYVAYGLGGALAIAGIVILASKHSSGGTTGTTGKP